MNDDLGNPIVVGNTYGASYSSGGTHVKLAGKAIKVNKTKTTLCIESGEYIERYTTEWRNLEVGSNKPIQHDRLFPVTDTVKLSGIVEDYETLLNSTIDSDWDSTVIEHLYDENPNVGRSFKRILKRLKGLVSG